MNTPITKIVVHCSDSPQGRGDDATSIHRWHKERGWSGIGYHYVITEDGVRQAGRPHYWEGAHVRGHNDGSLGVCLIGRKKFTKVQKAELYSLLVELCKQYPRAIVYGHRDLDPNKDCPGFNVASWLEREHKTAERERYSQRSEAYGGAESRAKTIYENFSDEV